MSQPTIAIVGASADRRKFGNKAVRAYSARGWRVFPVNPHAIEIEGHVAYSRVIDVPVTALDRASFYVPPHVGLSVLPDLARKPAAQVWFNPGSDSPELLAAARRLGLNVVEGCSIVDIGADPHERSVD